MYDEILLFVHAVLNWGILLQNSQKIKYSIHMNEMLAEIRNDFHTAETTQKLGTLPAKIKHEHKFQKHDRRKK